MIPKRVRKNENDRNNETVNGDGLNHGESDKERRQAVARWN
jgi:hypothetical protein